MILYKGYIPPQLEHAIQARSPYLQKDIESIERVQRKATKLVKGLSSLSYENCLQGLHLTTLEKRRLRGYLTEIYTLLTARENIDFGGLLQLDNTHYDNRGYQCKLKKQRSCLDIRKNFFSNRAVTLQNGTSCLPTSSKLTPSRPSRCDWTSATSGAIKAFGF